MSGPIVRKYGFPNFDKIFGERPLEHGVDESEPPPAESPGSETPPDRSAEPNEPEEPATPTEISPPTEFGAQAE